MGQSISEYIWPTPTLEDVKEDKVLVATTPESEPKLEEYVCEYPKQKPLEIVIPPKSGEEEAVYIPPHLRRNWAEVASKGEELSFGDF